MSKVVVYTQAYNAEKTLRRSLDSVLKQTFQDLTYYVVDNCSTDGTREIIQEYVSKDHRIRPIYYDVNAGTGSGVLRTLSNIKHIREAADFEWLCILDAGDTYEPEFLQEMLEFSHRQHLDMAVCSSCFIQSAADQQISARSVPQEVLIGGEGFREYFPIYDQFMRTWCAKLISRSAVEQADLESIGQNASIGGDTMLTFAFLRHCRRVGLSPKLLHNYMMSPTSSSYHIDPTHIGADAVQHYAAVDFLKEKVGEVSSKNLGSLHLVYCNAVADKVNVLLDAVDVGREDKLAGLRQLLSIDVTLEMLGSDAVELDKRQNLIEQIWTYVTSLGENTGRYEDEIWLGLTLASLVGDQEEYVRFSKLQIQYLFENQRCDEAQKQLDEWESILPGDLDLAHIRKQMAKKDKTKYKGIFLLGLTQYTSVAAARLLESNEAPKLLAVCDLSGQHCGKNLEISRGKTVPVIDFAQMARTCRRSAGDIAVLITEDPFRWNAVLESLRKAALDDIYIVPTYVYREVNLDLFSSMYQVPMDRPMLTYYEYQTAHHCNLNCFHCTNFSNVLSGPAMGDLELYKKDVVRLKELFWNVGRMRFQGGEPLLNPKLPEFISVTREAFPVADMAVLSNGLLIPKADPALFEAMRKYHVYFWLSGYPPTYRMKDKIIARCDAEGIPISIMPEIEQWRMESIKALGAPPSTNWKKAQKWWSQCPARDSHLLKDGYLYYCCFTSPLIPALYDRLGMDIKDNHMWQHLDNLRFDLSDPKLDGWAISQKLDHVHECCLYCVNRWPNVKNVSWRVCPSAQIKVEDYDWEPEHLNGK